MCLPDDEAPCLRYRLGPDLEYLRLHGCTDHLTALVACDTYGTRTLVTVSAPALIDYNMNGYSYITGSFASALHIAGERRLRVSLAHASIWSQVRR